MLLSPALTQAGSMGISLFPAPRLGGKPSPAGSQTTVKQLLPFDGMQWQGTHRRSQPTSPALLHSSQPPATQLGSRSPRAQPGQPLERGAPRAAAKPQGLGSVVLWGQSQCRCLADGTALPWGAGQPRGPREQWAQGRGAQLSPRMGSPRHRSSLVAGGAGAGVTRGQPKMWAYRRSQPLGQGSGQGHRDTGTEHPDGCTQGAPQSGAAGSAALTLQR